MDINSANMASLFTGFKRNFENGLGMAPSYYTQFATETGSGTSIEEYPFLELFAGMREWIGPRQAKNLASKKLQVKNRNFEDTAKVSKFSIEDDQYGVYAPIITQLGQGAGKLWNDLSVEALVGNGAWLDGAAFFGTTRKFGANTISNYTTGALTETTFNAAYLTMQGYLGHNDKPLGVIPNLLVVGPKLRTTAWNIVKNQFAYDATAKVQIQNVNQNLTDLLVLPDLVGAYDDYWFLMQTTGVLKPVILQKRKDPVFTRLDAANDSNMFLNAEAIYGVEARGAAALTMPHLCYAGIL